MYKEEQFYLETCCQAAISCHKPKTRIDCTLHREQEDQVPKASRWEELCEDRLYSEASLVGTR